MVGVDLNILFYYDKNPMSIKLNQRAGVSLRGYTQIIIDFGMTLSPLSSPCSRVRVTTSGQVSSTPEAHERKSVRSRERLVPQYPSCDTRSLIPTNLLQPTGEQLISITSVGNAVGIMDRKVQRLGIVHLVHSPSSSWNDSTVAQYPAMKRKRPDRLNNMNESSKM